MRIRSLYLIALSCILFGCSISFNKPAAVPGLHIEPATKSLVLIDGGVTNTPGLAIKNKREKVVKDVKNQYLVTLFATLQRRLHLIVVTDTTLTEDDKNKLLRKDPVAVTNLVNRHNSAIVLILKDCYSGFRQERVDRIQGFDGSKSKMAEYSVFFDTDWIVLQGNTINERTVTASTYHSDRSVQSGLLARGPGFQANKEDLVEMAKKNAHNVAQLFKY